MLKKKIKCCWIRLKFFSVISLSNFEKINKYLDKMGDTQCYTHSINKTVIAVTASFTSLMRI